MFQRFSLELFHLLLVVSPRRIKFPAFVLRMLDMLAGISQTLFGISGPIAMTRLISSYDNQLKIRNYALAFFLCMNLFRVGSYIVNGTFNSDHLVMMIIAAPFLIVTLWHTSHWHAKVNFVWFRRVVTWAILLGGVVMLVQIFSHQ